jgi:hypothetical protein
MEIDVWVEVKASQKFAYIGCLTEGVGRFANVTSKQIEADGSHQSVIDFTDFDFVPSNATAVSVYAHADSGVLGPFTTDFWHTGDDSSWQGKGGCLCEVSGTNRGQGASHLVWLDGSKQAEVGIMEDLSASFDNITVDFYALGYIGTSDDDNYPVGDDVLDVEIDIWMDPGQTHSPHAAAGVILAYTDTNNYAYAIFNRDGDLYIRKVDDGTPVLMALYSNLVSPRTEFDGPNTIRIEYNYTTRI